MSAQASAATLVLVAVAVAAAPGARAQDMQTVYPGGVVGKRHVTTPGTVLAAGAGFHIHRNDEFVVDIDEQDPHYQVCLPAAEVQLACATPSPVQFPSTLPDYPPETVNRAVVRYTGPTVDFTPMQFTTTNGVDDDVTFDYGLRHWFEPRHVRASTGGGWIWVSADIVYGDGTLADKNHNVNAVMYLQLPGRAGTIRDHEYAAGGQPVFSHRYSRGMRGRTARYRVCTRLSAPEPVCTGWRKKKIRRR